MQRNRCGKKEIGEGKLVYLDPGRLDVKKILAERFRDSPSRLSKKSRDEKAR